MSFVGTNSIGKPYFYCFDRNVSNPSERQNDSLYFSDEFSDSLTIFSDDILVKKWNQQYPTCATQDKQPIFPRPFSANNPLIEFKQFEGNSNKYISLEQVKDNDPNDQYWSYWYSNQCSPTTATIKYGQIQTGFSNCKFVLDPVTHKISFNCNEKEVHDSCAPQNIPVRMEIRYGFIETKCKIPRGRNLWQAMWFLPADSDWEHEIDFFESPGNGNMMLVSNLDNRPFGTDQHWYVYPVGFRYYDDFYTYGLNWAIDDLSFYFNNQKLFSFTNGIPDTLMFLIAGNGHEEKNIQHCEIEGQEPHNFDIDYIRVYKESQTLPNKETNLKQLYQESKQDAEIIGFPNPTKNEYTIIFTNEVKEGKIEIFNLLGVLLETVNFENMKSVPVDFSNKKSSSYIIKVTFDNQTKVLPAVKY
ncbi:MAG: family 16 glycosylhydrolase [Bacteroidales bacterium]|jgi:hypothetical protein|nr:family 16 glycosylhydrolase [Bacteroidales bacterium]